MTKRKPSGTAPRQPVAVLASATGSYLADQAWLLALVLTLITFVAYTPVWRAGFIWDDKEAITENQTIKASDGLYRIWCTTEPADYWPLTATVRWLEWRLWGNSPTGYHGANVLLHAANAVLIWMILRRLKIPGAWLAGLMFAIHPVNVATVAWISEQKNTLSMLFYTVAILLYLRFDEEGRWRWYGFSLTAFLLALLSKAAVVMLPVVLLACVWWTRGRIRKKDLLCSIPFFALSLVLGLVTVWFQHNRAMGGVVVRTDSFLLRLAAAGWVPWFYLYKACLPFNLTVIYPKWDINASRWLPFLPGLVLVGGLAVFWWKRKSGGRALLFALGYFVVTLFPVLGFFEQAFHQYSFVADHWQYFSIIGPIALTVAAGVIVCRPIGKWGRDVGVAVGAIILMALGVATWTRARVYADSQTLWRDNVTKNPNASVAHNNLGNDLSNAGEIHQAIEHYERALAIKPDYTEAHNNLGIALLKTGKLQEAIEQYELALRYEPTVAETHYNLGNALDQAGRIRDAISHYYFAVQINQQHAEAHNNLGIALEKVGQARDALGHYEQAVRIKPDNAEAQLNLGSVLLQLGRSQEAIGHLEQALQIKPDFAMAHSTLGLALERMGKVEDAIRHCQQALRLQPDFAEAHNNLGIALIQVERVQEAIAHFEQALRLQPDFAEAQHNLARARAVQ